MKLTILCLVLSFTFLACSVSSASQGVPTVVHTATMEPTLMAAPAEPTFTVFLPTVGSTATPPPPAGRIQPADLIYIGAFRLPDDGERPLTFEYSGNAMTYRPGSDTDADGYPGTLFLTGHDRLAYGELPNGSQLAEVNIPVPINSKDDLQLNMASFKQGFHDVAAGHFSDLDEIPRIGLVYLNHPATGPKLHMAWGQHIAT